MGPRAGQYVACNIAVTLELSLRVLLPAYDSAVKSALWLRSEGQILGGLAALGKC